MDFKDLLNAPKNLADEVWGKPFKLINVHEIPDEEMKANLWSGILEFFMKNVIARDFSIALNEAGKMLREIDQTGGSDYVVSLVNYALKTSRMKDKDKFTKTVKHHLTEPTGEKIMTLAEVLFEDGMQQGIIKGMQEGKLEGKQEEALTILIRLLKRKFDEIPPVLFSKISTANEQALLTWCDQLLEAKTLSDVFVE